MREIAHPIDGALEQRPIQGRVNNIIQGNTGARNGPEGAPFARGTRRLTSRPSGRMNKASTSNARSATFESRGVLDPAT